ncbi:MAG: rane-flanked domain protein [Frankiales bacterium]|nr:rane-flanked domain protein [Frankiales bacterium]
MLEPPPSPPPPNAPPPRFPPPRVELSPVPWRRLSGRMLLIQPVRELIRYIPVLLGVFLAGRGTGQGHWFSLALLGVVLVLSVVRWVTTRYQITEDQVQLKTGLLRRRVITTPADRVRSVDVTAHALHRILGVAKVVIGTGTSDHKKEGLVLDGLAAPTAYALREELLHRGSPGSVGVASLAQTSLAPTRSPAPPETQLLKLDPTWARLAPFTLSGAVTGLAVLGFAWNVLQQSSVDAGDLGAVRSASRHLQNTALWIAIAQVLLVVVVIISALSVIGYLLAFWNFRLTRHPGGSLQVSRGLLTTRMTSIEHRRLHGVGLSEPLLLRAVGGARLVAIATGLRVGRGAERGGTVLAPPAPFAVIRGTAIAVLDEAGASAAIGAPLTRHHPAARRRRIVRAATLPLALVVANLALWRWTSWSGWFSIGSLGLLAAATAIGVDRYRSLGHAVTGAYLVSRFGSIDRRRAALETAAIIGWNTRQSLFQRRLGLVTLTATTAAGRQSYPISDLTECDAISVMNAATPDLISQFCGPDRPPGRHAQP